ncbi:MAG TPA: TonB-dependent receptor [Verrucomicrobiae bacterium]|nr:TonB-dependent receptor [Verrucomicrobiae bacterium]
MKSSCRKFLPVLTLLFLAPALGHAHTAGGDVSGLRAGFSHPWTGWDHLLAMFAVGFWAARHRGRAVWLIPLSFVSLMAVGGIVGAAGGALPGAELLILASVVVFGLLAISRVRLKLSNSLLLVGFFALFHGFAHGREMPGSASLASFGSGFVLATILLHGLGLAGARVAAVLVTCLMGGSAVAQTSTNTPATNPNPNGDTNSTTRLPTVVVTGRQDSLLNYADSATQGTVGADQLSWRPTLRAGEILETVPGVIITQHAGGGKANQYFLRGFNLDHGTDFATDLDGMPLNLTTHAHGQGYSDMNVVIPELIERVNYEKGVYAARDGDFASAGAAHLDFFKVLPENIAIAEGGMYGYARGVIAGSPKLGDGHLLYGAEAYHDDGPWQRPDDYQKFNGILTYSQGDTANGFSVTGRAYHGKWNSSDQTASSAIESGLIPLYGSLDNSTGGNSQRYSLQAEWHRQDEHSATRVMAYGFYYDLDLFSDFTYYLTDTTRGDQFEQSDRRWVTGLSASHTIYNTWGGREVENTFGLQVRNDWIDTGLYQTQDRQRVDKIDAATGNVLPATTRADDLSVTAIGLYFENKVQWASKFRTVAGIRGDLDFYDVHSNDPRNSGSADSRLPSPKLSLIFGPWADTEIYVQGGFGFHSNDGRSTTTTQNPDGTPGTRIDGLVQTKGAEIGIRTLAVPRLQSTVSVWYLHSDSELLFEGDTGNTVATPQPSNRYGVEWANYYTPLKWLAFDLDYANSIARFTEADSDGGTHVPEAIEQVLTAGVTVHDASKFTTSLRLRYFGPRDLISNGSFRSGETLLLNLHVGYQISKHWHLAADVFNLLDRRDHDIDYAYESRTTPGGAPATEIHFHPVEPIQARFSLSARF